MGDKITDLSEKLDVPPVPLKTYQWEDIRRQKQEGRYPWTHLYKPLFDKEKQAVSKEHEYEPVTPMNTTKNTSPLPTLKITADKEICTNAEPESPDMVQDKRHLCIPDNEDSDESDEDDSDGITAEELQRRLEERYFKNSASNSGTKSECEQLETRSVSPTLSSHSHTKSDSSLSFHDRMQTRADKLKRRLKNFKDHISMEGPAEGKISDCTKKAKPAKKNKFNFRKRNAKSQESHSSNESKIRSPQTSRRRFSLPRLPSFSRSRSNSVKERESKRSQSSDADSRKFFSYPRMFNSCKSKKKLEEELKFVEKAKAKSAPPTPSTRRQSPFPNRWVSKFIDHKKDEKPPLTRKTTKKGESAKGCVVAESIFISLHEDSATNNAPKEEEQTEVKRIEEERFEKEPTDIEELAPSKMKIDNKNFIFISLHEERFPEKLKQLEEEEQEKEILEEEREIEKELHQARTARKFHIMLKRIQNDCKARAFRAEAADDKPEPVVITEVTDDCADPLNPNLSYDIEQPRDELFIGDTSLENRQFENLDSYKLVETTLKDRTFREQSKFSDDSLEVDVEVERDGTLDAGVPNNVIPQKIPRRKLKNMDSADESKESCTVLEDNVFTLDHQRECVPDMAMRTYIKAKLERTVPQVECDHTTRHFKEYEKALGKSLSQSSFEIENNYYSNTNSLARMETPLPPARPSRTCTLAKRKKREISSHVEHKENYYDLDANVNYHTFPAMKPDKPRRKFRERRTYSNSTTTTEMRNIDELEDETINSNIVNAKQLSVSFLPLSSNIVGEPIIDYNLRETSSMVHLNLSADPPLPPKRRKNRLQNSPDTRFSSLPNRRYYSKGSLPPSENVNHLGYRIDADMEYADDVSSSGPTPTPPQRSYRRRNTSLTDDGGIWREMESLSSGKSSKNQNASCEDADSRTANEYAVIEAPKMISIQESKIDSTMSMPQRIGRRVSDFFTIPRLRPPTNYVSECSQTLDIRRLPSPSRPPRRYRRPPNREHVYTNDEPKCIDFNEEEQLDFRLATERETPERGEDFREDSKNLETHDIFERMKSRPLPPPPRPIRKAKEDHEADYSQCVKKKPVSSENGGNDLGCNTETRTANEDDSIPHTNVTRSMWNSWERKTTVREFEISSNGERREISTPLSQSEEGHTFIRNHDPQPTVNATQSDNNGNLDSSTRYCDNELVRRQSFSDLSTQMCQSKEVCPAGMRNDVGLPEDLVHVITAAKLNVSELNVGRMNVSEIDSSRLVTSNVESSSIQVNDVRTETGHVIVNSVNYSDCMSAPERCPLLDATALRETTPMSNEDLESAETASVRSRISSMVPEIGSEDEGGNAGISKVSRPSRRKRHQAQKRELEAQQQVQQVPRVPAERNHATLAELMSQILRICYSSVGEALNSLFESVIPEDRDKRNEVQAAIWVITIIVAGCLMLGLQSNEKVVHHHHWDFHFPPPH